LRVGMPRSVTKAEKFERFEVEGDPTPLVGKLIGEGYIHICLSYWPKTKKWTVVAPKLKRPSEEEW